MRAEAEHLTKEIEEVERKQRELKEAELERLMQEKERLEEEKRVEQQRMATLRGSERAVEWRWQHCCLRLAQVGHLLKSQSRPRKGWTKGQGSLSRRGTVRTASHGRCCVGGTQRDAHGVASCVVS